MGLDLTSAPLGMWNRGLVVMGGRVLGDDMGRERSGRGGPRVWGGVPFGSGRTGQGGRMQEGLASGPGCVGGGGSHSAGAHMEPCQQCNYSSF